MTIDPATKTISEEDTDDLKSPTRNVDVRERKSQQSYVLQQKPPGRCGKNLNPDSIIKDIDLTGDWRPEDIEHIDHDEGGQKQFIVLDDGSGTDPAICESLGERNDFRPIISTSGFLQNAGMVHIAERIQIQKQSAQLHNEARHDQDQTETSSGGDLDRTANAE